MTASASAAAFAPPTPTSTSAQAARWATSAPMPGATQARPAQDSAQAAVQRAAPAPQQAMPLAPPRPVANVPAAAPAQQPVRAAAPAPAQAPARAAEGLRPPANVQYTSSVAKAPERAEPKAETVAPRVANSGWIIQIAATDDEAKAKGMLSNARSRSAALADARPFTETVERGGSTLWRARFAGFDDQAEADKACRDLKRSGFSCFATRI